MDLHKWWQHGVVYQIYPRSFMDSNGDGIGDLDGIAQRLDYLSWLGIDAIWISPIFPSPMKDFGYDISDYCGIHEMFGTLDRFFALIQEAHRRSIRVILDFVPNHTSDQHPWFLESRSSRQNHKRDWYVWRDAAPDGGPPNNWLSHFGGGAWEWDELTDQYYYHAFLKEQPDLNWRNPEVRKAMYDVLRFWFDHGVDGFRIDVLWLLIEDEEFTDNPINDDWVPNMGPFRQLVPEYTADQPEIHDICRELRAIAEEYKDKDRVLIGEIYLPLERLVMYYGEDGQGIHLPFNFQLITLPWNAQIIKNAIDEYEAALPPHGWPNWVCGNHDNHRIASRVGENQARVAAVMLLTLRGTPTLYYGDEIGMHDVPIPQESVQDPFERNVPGLGLGRDPERTPMQWDASPNSGFTKAGVKPWLPLASDYAKRNVEAQKADTTSVLALYKKLLELRRSEPALSIGSYSGFECHGHVVTYIRKDDRSRFFVALNFSREDEEVSMHGMQGAIVLSSFMEEDVVGTEVQGRMYVRGNEAVIIRIAADYHMSPRNRTASRSPPSSRSASRDSSFRSAMGATRAAPQDQV